MKRRETGRLSMHTYAFGAFELDPARRSLTRTSGEPVALGGKAFDALVCLLENAGDVVTRHTLSRALWPTTVVEDNNLSQTIQGLRRALGDSAPPHQYIVTVPRRGYQFVASVTVRRDVAAAELCTAKAETRADKAASALTGGQPSLPAKRAGLSPRGRDVRSIVVIAGATSLALNLLLVAVLVAWNSHRNDLPRSAAASARSAAPVRPARGILERDKRELSTT